jgi:hypothetical protein
VITGMPSSAARSRKIHSLGPSAGRGRAPLFIVNPLRDKIVRTISALKVGRRLGGRQPSVLRRLAI